jgi:hypothetical protein
MKIFLDDFIVYSGMQSHYKSSYYVFKRAKNMALVRIQTNVHVCLFLRMILGFIVSKERKLLDPKEIQTIVNMPPPRNPQ